MGDLQAVCNSDFNWVVHPDMVWDDYLPDVPGLHDALCDEIIDEARHLKGPHPALGRLVLGAGGSGKTHLLAKLRRRAVRENITFILADLTDVRRFFETLLLDFVVSLQQPDASGQTQLRAILVRLIGMLDPEKYAEEYVRRLLALDPERLAKTVTPILRELQRKDRIRATSHGDVVRAAILLAADNFDASSIGNTWLQGMEIEDEARQLYGFVANQQRPSDIVQGLSWLASFRGPIIIAIDQLDPIVAYNRQAARAERLREHDESVELAKSIIQDLCNGLGGLYSTTVRTLPVVTCLEGSLNTLMEYGLKSNLDRFADHQSLTPVTDIPIAEDMVRRRLFAAYDDAGFSPPYSTWPFAGGFFAGTVGRMPREILKRCEAHRKQCLDAGAVTELHTFDGSQTAPEARRAPASGDSLDRRFEELRQKADLPRLLNEQWEDENLSGLMVTAAACLVKESPESDAFDAVVDSEFPGRATFMPLHARIRKIELASGSERHYCIRALEKMHPIAYQARLRAAMTSSGIDRKLNFRNLVIFRANPVPRGAKTEQLTKDFHDKGGVMVTPKRDDLATLWALQQLAAEGHDAFDSWLAERQPVHRLPMMQKARLAKPPGDDGSGGDGSSPRSGPVRKDGSVSPTQTADAKGEREPAVPGGGVVPAGETAAPPMNARAKGDQGEGGMAEAPIPREAPAATEKEETRGSKPAPEPPVPAAQPAADPAAVFSMAEAVLPCGRRVLGSEARGDSVAIPLLELKKHVAIFAGAGSGKTVLVKRLIEEAVLVGVPAIVIDTANDLAQLADPWPSPPSNWESDDADKAARYFQHTETVVWTPGLEGGNPLNIAPLPDLAGVADDVDELNQAIDMAREALHGIVAPGKSETAHKRLGILTAALHFFAKQGGGSLEDLVALLADLPPDAGGDIGDAPKQAAKMADALRSAMQIDPMLGGSGEALDPAVLLGLNGSRGRTRISVINFAGLTTLDQQQQFLNRLAMALFAWIKRHPAGGATPLRGLLVVDEAKDFVPSVARSACRDAFLRLTAQARKYGLGIVYATQAPKEIHNVIVSNCSTSFYGKGNSPTVINAIKEMIQNKGGQGNDVARLGQGRFYVHNADVTPTPVKIGTRLCLSHHRDPLAPDAIAARSRESRDRLGGT